MPLELPEDFEDREAIASRFDSVEALAKSYRELEKKIGGMLPSPTSEESKLELFKRLGAPETPDGYELPPGVDPGAVAGLTEFAAAARLTPEQFARMAEEAHRKAQSEYEAKNEARAQEASRVKAEWGDKFPEAQARVLNALKTLGPEQAQQYDIEDPAVFRLLERLGSVDRPTAGTAPVAGASSIPSFDPVVVAAEARKILSSEAYRDRSHPEHQTAQDEYGNRAMKLMEAGYDGAYDAKLIQHSTPWSR